MSLAEVLEKQGRRRAWVAERLGVARSTVDRWCTGEWPVPATRVEELARLLEVESSNIAANGGQWARWGRKK